MWLFITPPPRVTDLTSPLNMKQLHSPAERTRAVRRRRLKFRGSATRSESGRIIRKDRPREPGESVSRPRLTCGGRTPPFDPSRSQVLRVVPEVVRLVASTRTSVA